MSCSRMEMRQKRKEKKEAIHKIKVEKIKQDVEASMEGSDKKAIEKAVRQAVSKKAIKRAKKAQVQHLITKTLINCFINMVSGSS